MGISERQMVTITWAELLRRVILLQRNTRLCVVKASLCSTVAKSSARHPAETTRSPVLSRRT